MTTPTDPLTEVQALLAAAATIPDVGARAVYLATARVRVDATAEQLRELRWLLEAAERELARQAEPTPTTIATERTEPT